jgi:3-dehydroquinate synthetase
VPQDHRTITVSLAADPYPILIGEGLLSDLGSFLIERGFQSGTRVLVVTNPEVQGFHGAEALAGLSALGPLAAGALTALIELLQATGDADEVRMLAAEALGSGSGGKICTLGCSQI